MPTNDIDKFNKPTSAVVKEGNGVTQVITFKGGYKATFKGIKTETIEQGKFTHFHLQDGRFILVNPENVFCIEVIK